MYKKVLDVLLKQSPRGKKRDRRRYINVVDVLLKELSGSSRGGLYFLGVRCYLPRVSPLSRPASEFIYSGGNIFIREVGT